MPRPGVEISATLQGMGYSVPMIVTTGEGALDIARAIKPDLVILGSVPPGKMNRVQVERQIGKRLTLPVVYLVPQPDASSRRPVHLHPVLQLSHLPAR